MGTTSVERHEIITDPSALRRISTVCDTTLTPENQDTLKALLSSMPENALGLAAPQIGIFKRMFVANVQNAVYVFVNPVITYVSPDTVSSEEACLSLPGVTRCVKRHQFVKIRADVILRIEQDYKGNVTQVEEEIRLRGLDAAVVQHEEDHLNGVLIIDLTEVPTAKQQTVDRMKKRGERIAKKRSVKADKERATILRKEKKPRKLTKKEKNKSKNERRRLQRRVEVQERILAEQEGLFESTSDKS